MKKIEKEFLNDFNNNHNIEFSSIINKADTSQYKNSKRKIYKTKGFWGGLTTILAILALVIGLSIYFTRPYVISFKVNNLDELVTEYELNSNLILDNLKIQKKMSNGKLIAGNKDELVIDSSSFNSTKPGEYRIGLSLKDNESLKDSYNVVVINETLEDIEVKKEETRNTYYQGESIKPEEIKIMKKRSKSNAMAKPIEIQIDDSKVKYNEIGFYNINVSLKTNESFKDNYDVEIKNIACLEINDRFYMSDDSYFYPPTILGMDIMSDVFIPYYSDIVLEGEIIKSVKNGNIILNDRKHKQEGIYNPYLGIIEVTGLTVSDKPIYLYRMDKNDKLVTLVTEKSDRFYTFVAIDNHLDSNTLNYLNDAFGSVYLDKERTKQVFSNTFINEDSNIYVSLKSDLSIEDSYLGKYMDENNMIAYDIISDGIRTYSNKNYFEYYVKKANNGLIVINIRGSEGSGSKLCYDASTDSLLQMVGGEIVKTYKRYNAKTSVIVTIVDRFNEYAFVHEKGFSYDSKHPAEILADKVIFLNNINYDGKPIYNDVRFDAKLSYIYLTDFTGRYGNYMSYIYIETNFVFGIEANRMKICYEIVNDLKQVEKGYLSFNSISYDENDKRIIEFKFESVEGNISYASLRDYSSSFNGNSGVLSYNGKDYILDDPNFLLDLDIIGDYTSSNGNKITIKGNGILEYTIIKSDSLSNTYRQGFFIKEVREDEIIAYYHDQDQNDKLVLIEINFIKLPNGSYEFVYKNNRYKKL